MSKLTPEDQKKQELYRDARFTNQYDQIWQSVGKCVFCDLKEKYVIFEENGIVLTISLFAYIDGHCMIMPRRHVRSPKELTDLEWDTVRKFSYIAKKLIKDVHSVKGMQLIYKDGVEAQSTVEHHLHFHCVPFDAPDLMEWNYRKLQYTPLENTNQYKQARKKIITSGAKFDKKYHQSHSLPIYCDVIILSSNREILFQERAESHKLSPDFLTPLGGKVESFTRTLQEELAREINEEAGITISPKDCTLLSSRVDTVKHTNVSKQLKATYPTTTVFLRNTYLLKNFDKNTKLTPGDDAENFVWIPINEIASHERISESTKEIIELIQDEQ